MTDKEATKIEKYLLDGYEKPNYKLAEMIMEAVEKQIPKKPKTLHYVPLINSGWKHECPNCGCAIGKNKNLEFAYDEYLEPYESNCVNCGQRLDWEDLL